MARITFSSLLLSRAALRVAWVSFVLACSSTLVRGGSEYGLLFDAHKMSLRAEPGATVLEFVFRFRNMSGEHVAVEQMEEGCGCLKGTLLFESVEPEGEGEIKGVMALKGLHGTVAKSMWLRFTNGERHELVAQATIPRTLVVGPVDLVWQRGADATWQQVVIRVESGPPMEVTGVVCNLPQFATRLETIEAGRHYILNVHPAATDKDLAAVIQVHTSSKNPRDAIRAVFASINDRKQQGS